MGKQKKITDLDNAKVLNLLDQKISYIKSRRELLLGKIQRFHKVVFACNFANVDIPTSLAVDFYISFFIVVEEFYRVLRDDLDKGSYNKESLVAVKLIISLIEKMKKEVGRDLLLFCEYYRLVAAHLEEDSYWPKTKEDDSGNLVSISTSRHMKFINEDVELDTIKSSVSNILRNTGGYIDVPIVVSRKIYEMTNTLCAICACVLSGTDDINFGSGWWGRYIVSTSSITYREFGIAVDPELLYKENKDLYVWSS